MNRKLLAAFGLKWNPFIPEIPDEALMHTPAVDHFCWRIEQQLRDGGFALATGDSGTGKSATLRLLVRHLSTLPEVMVGSLNRPQSRVGDFYREMGEVFGLSLSPANRYGSFKVLREKWEAHLAATLWRPVLIIDEAQEMKLDVFHGELQAMRRNSRFCCHLKVIPDMATAASTLTGFRFATAGVRWTLNSMRVGPSAARLSLFKLQAATGV